MTFNYYLFLGLAIASILAQIPHAYYTFNNISRLKGALKMIQSIMFCSILSIAIFGFVWIGETKLAMLGAAIEIIINLYYYTMDFWEIGFGQKTRKTKAILKFWRTRWFMFFVGVLIPILIYVFSDQLKQL